MTPEEQRWLGERSSLSNAAVCGLRDRAEDAERDGALARNAFEVMTRRGMQGWCVMQGHDGSWGLATCMLLNSQASCQPFAEWIANSSFSDPFTAWVESDAWYKANVEKKDAAQA